MTDKPKPYPNPKNPYPLVKGYKLPTKDKEDADERTDSENT